VTGDLLTLAATSDIVGPPTVSAPVTVTLTLSYTPSGGSITLLWTATRIYTNLNGQTQSQTYILVEEGEEVLSVTKWDLPSLTTESVIQDTPKAEYASMKEFGGIYMVKRVFQPVFNVAAASSYRRVRMLSTADTIAPATYTGGRFDTFDVNYSTGVVIMSSIPVACAPAIKLIRDIEVVATDDSVWSPMMASNELPIPAAIDIARCISEVHPFAYPEAYNVLGTLGALLGGIVSKIPIIGQVAPVISNVMKGIMAMPSATTRPATGLRSLTDLGPNSAKTLEETMIQLMGQMGLGD